MGISERAEGQHAQWRQWENESYDRAAAARAAKRRRDDLIDRWALFVRKYRPTTPTVETTYTETGWWLWKRQVPHTRRYWSLGAYRAGDGYFYEVSTDWEVRVYDNGRQTANIADHYTYDDVRAAIASWMGSPFYRGPAWPYDD